MENKTIDGIELVFKNPSEAYKDCKIQEPTYLYGYQDKKMKQLTNIHKLRIFMGVNGQHHDGTYCYTVPKWGGFKTQRMMFTFMHFVGNPIMNFVLGKGDAFKKVD